MILDDRSARPIPLGFRAASGSIGRGAFCMYGDFIASVAEAAMECGFDNFSYFSKMFRSVYRCTRPRIGCSGEINV